MKRNIRYSLKQAFAGILAVLLMIQSPVMALAENGAEIQIDESELLDASPSDADLATPSDADINDLLALFKASYDYSGFNYKINELRNTPGLTEGTSWTNSNAQYPSGWYGCKAFANRMAYEIFGQQKPQTYWTVSTVANIVPGDYISTDLKNSDGSWNYKHTMFVIAVNGDTLTLAEGNYSGKVHWGRQVNKWNLGITIVRHAPNYDSVIQNLNNQYCKGTLDVNGLLDGERIGGLSDYGTVDVYINGSLAADDVSDYCQQLPAGTAYEIKDIKTKGSHVYNGLASGSDTLTGTVAANVTRDVRLSFSTMYTVKFSTSHGTAPKSQTVIRGGKATDPGSLSASGYKFGGWYADSNYKTPWDFDTAITQNTTIYAKWTVNSYKVTFNTGGIGKGVASQTVTRGKYAKDPGKPTATGYTFGGWYADSAFKTKWDFTKNKITKATTIYGKWTANTYTIVFNGNGASSGSMKELTKRAYGKSYTLTANAYKKNGYLFLEWNTKKDGTGKAYADKASVKNLTSKNKGTVTLYAQWAKSYKITYVLDGGTNSAKNPPAYTEEKTVTLYSPTKAGYTFGGWYSDSWFQNKVTQIPRGSRGNKKLYARWIRTSYSVKFNGNGSTSGSMSSMNSCKGETAYKLAANKFKRTGYTFTGWNTKADGSGKSYADKASFKNLTSKNGSTVTLYAQWKVNTYTISFSANGGTGSMASVKATYGKAVTLKACSMKKSGKFFAGWNTKADGSGTSYADKASVKNLTTVNGKTVVLYAQWGVKSGWVLSSQVPAGATVVERKWKYTKVEKKTSETILAGWDNVGTVWEKTGSGSSTYADFPASGYYYQDPLYSAYSGKNVSPFENDTTKRTVSTPNPTSHIYWHWTHVKGYLSSGNYNCFVNNKPGVENGRNYQYFTSFESTVNYGHYDRNGVYQSDVVYAWRDQPNDGSWWWYEIPIYTVTYEDFKKMYQLEKRTAMESATEVTPSATVTDVEEYVRYISD